MAAHTEKLIFKKLYDKEYSTFTKHFVILGNQTRCTTDLYIPVKDNSALILDYCKTLNEGDVVECEYVNCWNEYNGRKIWSKYLRTIKKV